MSDIFPETPITSLPEAVAFMGALPMKVGSEPKPLSADRLAEIRSLDLLALMDDRAAPVISGHLAALLTEIGRLTAQRDRRRTRLVALQNDALNMRGALSPMGEDRKVPFPLGPTLLPAAEWLIGRVAELERLLAEDGCSCPPADHPHQVGCPLDLPAPGSPERPVNELTAVYMPVAALREDVSPQVEKLRNLLAGQRAAVEDPHDSPLHHDYRLGHDLPESGGGGRD